MENEASLLGQPLSLRAGTQYQPWFYDSIHRECFFMIVVFATFPWRDRTCNVCCFTSCNAHALDWTLQNSQVSTPKTVVSNLRLDFEWISRSSALSSAASNAVTRRHCSSSHITTYYDGTHVAIQLSTSRQRYSSSVGKTWALTS